MRKLAVLFFALAIAPNVFAQNNPSLFESDRTTQGATINLVGGVPPFRLYRELGPNDFDFILQANSGPFVISNMPPNSSRKYKVAGSGVAPGSGTGITIFSLPIPDGPYADVPSNFWAVDAIQWMKDNEITSGCGNGNYCPNDTVTRAQMAVFMKNLYDLIQSEQQ